MSLSDLRAREFAWPDDRIYLNAASYGPLPRRTKEAIEEFHERRYQALLVDPELVAPQVAARASCAQLIGAAASEIALGPNTQIGVNIGATATICLAQGRRILVSDREFPANMYPWLLLGQHRFNIETIDCNDNGWPSEDVLLEKVASGDVATLAISFVQFASGYRANLQKLGEACRANDVLFVVDAIQGVGAVPLDVRECNIDILACGGQKWLCSPWGSGFTYVRKELIQTFEPMLPGWLSFKATQDFTRLTDYRYELLEDARRFETGTLGFQDYLGLNESLQLMLDVGIDKIWQHIRDLQQPIIQWAKQRNVQITSDLCDEHRSGIVCIKPANPTAAHEALQAAQVRCAFRENSIRISPHWYNTPEEIERVVQILDAAI